MAALAYLMPPVSGLVAYLFGATVRIRWHGLQAVLFGVLWPVALYVGSWLAPIVTRAVFGLGMVVWLGLIVGTARGRDVVLPILGAPLKRAAEVSPRARD